MPTRDINIKNLFDSLPHRTYTFEVGEGRFEALVPYGNGSIKGVKRILFQYTERRIIIFSNELRYQNQGFNTKLFGEKGGQIFDELYTAFASYIKTNGCIGSFDFTPYLEKRTKVEIYNPETLILKNFGDITEVEIHIPQVTVLTGDHTKSIITKLLAMLYTLKATLWRSDNLEGVRAIFTLLIEDYGISDCLKPDTYIFWANKAHRFVFDANRVTECMVVDESYWGGALYAPAERLVIPAVEVISDSLPYKDLLLFARLRNLKAMFEEARCFTMGYIVKKHPIPFLGVAYSYTPNTRHGKDRDIITYENGTQKALSECDASYQAAVPMIVSMSHCQKTNTTFIIELPELCLSSTQQKAIIEHIVQTCLHNHPGNKVIISTESCYVTATINNLIAATEAYNKQPDKLDFIRGLVPMKQWLNISEVSAHEFEKGTATKVINRDEEMILEAATDAASGSINDTFSELIKIRYPDDDEY